MKDIELLPVVLTPLADLIPYQRNARTHSDEQVEQIAESIREFGWTQPILVGKGKLILAGHGRRLAAIALRLKQVPTIDLSHLSEEQQRLYIIADNKLTLNGGWDMNVLKLEVLELGALGMDLSLTGFSEIELDSIIQPEEPEPPEPEKGEDNRPTCPHCGQKYNEQT